LNLKGLKAEISRRSTRLFKKSVQANEKLSKAQQILADTTSALSVLQKDEGLLNIEILEAELQLVRDQLREVKQLEEVILTIKSVSDVRFAPLLPIIDKYNITDTPPPPPERGPKKVKSAPAPSGPRKPYNTFISSDKIEIRVGRRAEDNDELSCNPEHRDGPDWWLHVAGHPGSHVVIRNHSNDLPVQFRETLKDAACLAAKNSKVAGSNNIQVTYTRCRHVTKPAGAKAGLVYLKGDIATIKVNLKAESERLARLEQQLQMTSLPVSDS
jgi:predicted ribosome quality control (RQC) complex YloA/Tae2 family protein